MLINADNEIEESCIYELILTSQILMNFDLSYTNIVLKAFVASKYGLHNATLAQHNAQNVKRSNDLD